MTETRYARNGDRSIAYQVVGDPSAPPVLFVPGFVSNLELQWELPAIARFLEELAGGARLVLFDKCGTGLSDGGQTDGSTEGVPGMSACVADIVSVLDAVGIERTNVFAISEGGPLALAFAGAHSGRVERLALFGTFAREPFGTARRAAAIAASVDELWGTGQVFAHLAPSWSDAVSRAFLARYERHSATPREAAALIRRAATLDVTADLAAVPAPTVVLHRAGDDVIRPARGRELAAGMSNARYVELPGADHFVYAGETDAVVEQVLAAVGREGTTVASRVFAALVFVDIVGSTTLADRLGDRAFRDLLDRFHGIADHGIRRRSGRRVTNLGDGLLATFPSASAAVRWACALRREVEPLGIDVRAGVHAAEVERRGDDLAGFGLHVAARVSAGAVAGEILVTRTAADLLDGSGIELVDRGRHELRGVDAPWQLFSVPLAPAQPLGVLVA
jgi:class 3 adenylate cyclase